MADAGRINCYGKSYAPQGWNFIKYHGINRLYYIHSGCGGYEVNGKKKYFKKDVLYFFPYAAEFSLFSDTDDPVLHTYVDYELIPPLVCNEVLSFRVGSDKLLNSAKDVFLNGAEYIRNNKMTVDGFRRSGELFSLCLGSITYLTEQIAARYGVGNIEDRVIVSVLEYMIENIDKKITVSELAKRHYMSEDGFIRHFRRILGITPYAYLKNLRIRTARYMMEDGIGLAKIAEATGYSDSASLLHAVSNNNKREF